jgi:glucuronosyltransferase
MVEALGELPYTVLWKWESDRLPGKPNNVVTRKWFPQQDILGKWFQRGINLIQDGFL